MVKCNACGGMYEPILSDGMQYFHRCPPLSRVELAAAIDAGKVAYPAGKTAADYQAKAVAAGLPLAAASLLAADDLLLLHSYERTNQRDENIVSAAPNGAATIKAAGAGVTQQAPAPPPVIKVG